MRNAIRKHFEKQRKQRCDYQERKSHVNSEDQFIVYVGQQLIKVITQQGGSCIKENRANEQRAHNDQEDCCSRTLQQPYSKPKVSLSSYLPQKIDSLPDYLKQCRSDK